MSRLTRRLVVSLALKLQRERADARRGRHARPDWAPTGQVDVNAGLTRNDNSLKDPPKVGQYGSHQP